MDFYFDFQCVLENKELNKSKITIHTFSYFTIATVKSVAKKMGSNALVQRYSGTYLCSQKLIDVQQTLIANPKSIEKYHFL
jgi:hypothetical protein